MLRLTETRLPETRKITVYNFLHDAKVARLAEVTFSNGTIAYIGWHDLAAMRKQFRQQFKRDLPGVTDRYQGKVRTVFSWETFYCESSGDEELWMTRRLPDRLTLEVAVAEPNPPLLQ